MVRAVLIAVAILLSLGFATLSHADGDEDETVVWGT
jgi:hypothetical protein